MRFLKTKIAKAGGLLAQTDTSAENLPQQPAQTSSKIEDPEPIASRPQRIRQPEKIHLVSPTLKKNISGDNIMKNYGRAMTNFALSKMAKFYLNPIVEGLNITIEGFQNYISQKKKSANCIKQLRAMLPLHDDQRDPDLNYKKAFQSICVVFLKFFCINWLYSSKIAEKVAHLRFRFKIMRRVKNPQYFTYLKDFHDHM